MRSFVKKTTSDKRFWAVLYVLMALLSIVSIYEGIANGLVWSQDFQYDAASALVNGYDPYDLSLGFEKEALPDIPYLKGFYDYYEGLGTPQRMEANQFPSLLYILAVYTLLPYSAARILWVITNIICTAVIIWLLKKTFMSRVDERLYPVFMMLMLAGTPWRNQTGVGQHTLFAVAFFLLAVYVSERGKDEDADRVSRMPEGLRTAVSGLLLSLSYIKYTVTAPLALYFIYKKKWKEFLISLVPHAVLTFTAASLRSAPRRKLTICWMS